MKLLKLEILNLASLDRQEGEVINFEEGALRDSTIFSIVGPTGSGKSTILDAICLALYNRAPRYPRKKGERKNIGIYGEADEEEKNRLSATDCRNILTRGKKKGYSKLTFLANNGDIYRAEWSVSMKTKNHDRAITSLYKLIKNKTGWKEESANWNDLPVIIGLDYEQFLRTVLIAQGSFSSFIMAKEDERFELLEKLIGCEELYTNISSQIKQQKDDAVKGYEHIVANFKAQEKDLIPEGEIEILKNRITELETEEKKEKEELTKITNDLAWYSTRDQYIHNIDKFEAEFNLAQKQMEDFGAMSQRLSLHDETLPVVNLYKDMKTAEEKFIKINTKLNDIEGSIRIVTQKIKEEEKVELAQLKDKVKIASDLLEQQKPHINKAREIKAKLEGLKKSIEEKDIAKQLAKTALEKAEKEVEKNRSAIQVAQANLEITEKNYFKLQKTIIDEEEKLGRKLADSLKKYNTEDAKLKKYDQEQLQELKSKVDRDLTDIISAIRISKDLQSKIIQKDENQNKKINLSNENKDIEERLKHFNIDKLSEDLDILKKTYTLMTSEKWEQHRLNLSEGEPCPLCGAKDHPYHEPKNVAPVIDKMKEIIERQNDILRQEKEKKEKLNGKFAENTGILNAIVKTLETLETDIKNLNKEWEQIKGKHPEWPADVEVLAKLKTGIEKDVENADKKLKDYNNLLKSVDKLRTEKEKTEKEIQEFYDSSNKKKNVVEKTITDLNTVLETEKGKSENLKEQLSQRIKEMDTATETLNNAILERTLKIEALKQEIGNKDPDLFEEELTTSKTLAEKAVNNKLDSISLLRQQQEKLKGEKSANELQKAEEIKIIRDKSKEVSEWLSHHNENKEDHLTEEAIALLCSANDDWEGIRATQKKLTQDLTAASTTLQNEKKTLIEHENKKPEREKEELLSRKMELESISHEELIDSKARLQRHEKAKDEMGCIFDKMKEAETYKTEWEEINDAIGSDGKTLRKIAQCYTLRFLIQHANAEIRKFNNRYELQQVKNSLGIRVIDHDRADDVRDTTSLSGGETFIVSLGLALGLSSLSSRNINFENLFIDEGFGTLDPDTLSTVIDSLAMLQSSQGKKVGVISHTDTMSERISTQIRIVKHGNTGSSHIEIYP